MSSKLSITSTSAFLYVPNTTQAFLKQITSQPLHEIFQIKSDSLCDDIKRLEVDFKDMIAEAKKTVGIYEQIEQANKKIERDEQNSKTVLLKKILLVSPIPVIGGASLAAYYWRYRTQPLVAVIGLAISFVIHKALPSLIPIKPITLQELPDLKLQARNLKTLIQQNIEHIGTQLKELNTKLRTYTMDQIEGRECKATRANRDQLIAAHTYFTTTQSHRSFD